MISAAEAKKEIESAKEKERKESEAMYSKHIEERNKRVQYLIENSLASATVKVELAIKEAIKKDQYELYKYELDGTNEDGSIMSGLLTILLLKEGYSVEEGWDRWDNGKWDEQPTEWGPIRYWLRINWQEKELDDDIVYRR